MVNRKPLYYNNKHLSKIEDINHFIDENGKTKSDLFNNKGALLVLKNTHPPEKIFHIPVYTYVEDIHKHMVLPVIDREKNVSEMDEQKRKQKHHKKIESVLGRTALRLYEQTAPSIDTILNTPTLTHKDFSTAAEIVGETIKQDHYNLHAVIQSLRTIDTYTYNHCFSVYLLTVRALQHFRQYINDNEFWDAFKQDFGKINFNIDSLKRYGVAALLHDYGKTLIPPEILNKPGSLTAEEFEVMKKHPRLGVEALVHLNIDEPNILEIVGNHHPQYLTFRERGQSPLVQIVNIVDIYDACRSVRPYKQPFSLEETYSILKSEKVKNHWDPFIFNIIINEVLPEFEKRRMQ